jgi:GxxExxY protein
LTADAGGLVLGCRKRTQEQKKRRDAKRAEIRLRFSSLRSSRLYGVFRALQRGANSSSPCAIYSAIGDDYFAPVRPNELTHAIIGAAIEVHRELGPGKPEAAYERALARALTLRDLSIRVQRAVPVVYKGVKLECGFRLDVLVCNTVVVEVKSVECVIPVHRAQTLTYLKLGGWKLALLLNFNVAILKQGIERLVFGFQEEGESLAVPDSPPSRVVARNKSTSPSLRSAADSGDREAEQMAFEIIDSAIEVHRELGPGLLPSAYEACLCHELHVRKVMFERNRPLALSYKGTPLEEMDEVELVVGGRVVVNPYAFAQVMPVHEARLLSQLRLGGWKLGLLINFNTIALKEGVRRIVMSRNVN